MLELDKENNALTFSLKIKGEDKRLAVLERSEHTREKRPEGIFGWETIWQTAPCLAQCSTQLLLVKYQFCAMTFLDFSQLESGAAGKEHVIYHL